MEAKTFIKESFDVVLTAEEFGVVMENICKHNGYVLQSVPSASIRIANTKAQVAPEVADVKEEEVEEAVSDEVVSDEEVTEDAK